jgi:hypothetical protein
MQLNLSREDPVEFARSFPAFGSFADNVPAIDLLLNGGFESGYSKQHAAGNYTNIMDGWRQFSSLQREWGA